MKAIKALCVLLVVVTATSCGNDDENNLPLVGTRWTQVTTNFSDCDLSEDNRTEQCTSDCNVFVLESDGTITYPEDEIHPTFIFTYTVSGNELTITVSNGEFSVSSSANFIIQGSTLSLFTGYDDHHKCNETLNYQGS